MILDRGWQFLQTFVIFSLYIHPVRGSIVEEKDSLLISDLNVQIEATEAVNDMYNFKFREAHKQFNWLKQDYTEHPLPYFLMGLNEWWKIMPNPQVEMYDETFLAYMDTSIIKARKLYGEDNTKVEGAFFLAASFAFKARLYTERSKWIKSAGNANRALNYLNDCRGKPELSPELLFGDGLYNYFSVWIPENYPQLRPFLILFNRGDKELGLEQLREVAHNAFYTRTEAQFWLMNILFYEENDPNNALHEAEYLHETFPDNPVFHRYYTRIMYSTGRFANAKVLSEEILVKIDSGFTGYEATSGIFANYYLARIWESNFDTDKALLYYQRTVEYSESHQAFESEYYHYSLFGLAEIYDKQGNRKEAEKCLKTLRKNSSRGSDINKRARELLKSLSNKPKEK